MLFSKKKDEMQNVIDYKVSDLTMKILFLFLVLRYAYVFISDQVESLTLIDWIYYEIIITTSLVGRLYYENKMTTYHDKVIGFNLQTLFYVIFIVMGFLNIFLHM
ncbi:hypothetical protein M2475_000881 [Breznakia sp. PF5-3]|uniref:hypothetical protein n=1 Tax=unclassified Breznakia TaxID=2623764 RepID=UPI00240513C0|nr:MULTISPECIES: hypothetical protein [unclassified Breznakia]MDF9824530.1 hypothetical protein [Breznakia sp. PM6-1]MDF9835316.1 hypothetical protein [Breznakia sp. PF5-3]MDF9837032.1 hypothetical protein [Breznakia sp. PFB2-8]MDF9858957.1 hypothetical protein [Breznakia sp. PH5-24]